MSENPYEPPTVGKSLAPVEPERRSLDAIAKSVFLAWEKLRIAYIAILAAITLLMIGATGSLSRLAVLGIVVAAIGANILYLAGPIVETYIRWLGYQRPWPRWFLFICGTLLSVVIAVVFLATELLPNQD